MPNHQFSEADLARAFNAMPPPRRSQAAGGRAICANAHKLPSILQAASSACAVTVPDLRSPSRKPALVRARQVVTFIARHHFKISSLQIGSAINRHHTTVLFTTHPRAVSELATLKPLINLTLSKMETL